jgi:hypothetical protein
MSRTALFTKTNIIAAVVVAVTAVTGGVLWANKSPEQPQVASSQIQQPAAAKAEVRADYVGYAGEDGKNALQLLKGHISDVQTKESSYGEFVASINGQDGGGKKYWTFYVNGEMAQVGAGAYQAKNTDKIEWKLQ